MRSSATTSISDLRIGRAELGADAPHRQLREQHGGGDAQVPAWRRHALARGGHGLGDLVHRRFDAAGKQLAGFGELQTRARCAR